MATDDDRVEREAEAAAAEAGAIGGQGYDEGLPEADLPVIEGGGGEAEGFEQSEELLQEHASHGDDGPDPTHMAGRPEDPAAAEAEYGSADEFDSSEDDREP
jgi:hypothetical protein